VHHGDGVTSWAVNQRAVHRGHGIKTGSRKPQFFPTAETARSRSPRLASYGASSPNRQAAVSPPSMRKSLPVMNPLSGRIRSAPTVPTSSGVPARPAGHSSIIRRYPSPPGPVISSLAIGVKMMPGLIVLTRASRLPPLHGLGHHPQRVSALGQLVGVQRVPHLVRLQHRQAEQLIGGRQSQSRVFLGSQRAQAVPGLRSDHDAGTSRRDDIAELLEHQGGAVQVDRKDCFRRRLAGGNAGRLDDAGDVPSAVAVWTSGCTDSRAETSTVTVLTSNPALLRTSAAASALQGHHGSGVLGILPWSRNRHHRGLATFGFFLG
jgi:hypothetical protein